MLGDGLDRGGDSEIEGVVVTSNDTMDSCWPSSGCEFCCCCCWWRCSVWLLLKSTKVTAWWVPFGCEWTDTAPDGPVGMGKKLWKKSPTDNGGLGSEGGVHIESRWSKSRVSVDCCWCWRCCCRCSLCCCCCWLWLLAPFVTVVWSRRTVCWRAVESISEVAEMGEEGVDEEQDCEVGEGNDRLLLAIDRPRTEKWLLLHLAPTEKADFRGSGAVEEKTILIG